MVYRIPDNNTDTVINTNTVRMTEKQKEKEIINRLEKGLSLIVETGDFERFAKGNQYAAYLGLATGGNSSWDIYCQVFLKTQCILCCCVYP